MKEDQNKSKPPSTGEYEEAVQKDRAAKEQDARELVEKAVFLKTFKKANKTVSTSSFRGAILQNDGTTSGHIIVYMMGCVSLNCQLSNGIMCVHGICVQFLAVKTTLHT